MTEEIELKDGTTSFDARLDRVVHFDERSRNFPIREALEAKQPRSYTWGCTAYHDQGTEGACVGFSWAHELTAAPVIVATTAATATQIYKRAQFLDPWPGEAYDGTSVLAGAKAVQEMRTASGKPLLPEYRWAFGVDDLVLAIGYKGPAVLGINWWSGMFEPTAAGFVSPTGYIAGGHAILCRGFRFAKKDNARSITWDNMDRDKSYFLLHNSWGRDWGMAGTCKITVNDMHKLLEDDGEACIPTIRI